MRAIWRSNKEARNYVGARKDLVLACYRKGFSLPATAAKLLAHKLLIDSGYVYENKQGEQRLVSSVSSRGVVIWRTIDPDLPYGVKAQGSTTEATFRKWAVSRRKATPEDWQAFDRVLRLREKRKSDQAFMRRYRRKHGL